MPADTAIKVAPGDHAVQVFQHADDFDRVVRYVTAALDGGDAAIVVATPDHRAAVQAACDRSTGRTGAPAGLVVQLDAAGLLSRIMVGDQPDRVAFERVVGEAVQRAGRAGGRVWVYGEMVALLWDAGNVAGAMALEHLWNDLRARLPLTLLCGYPVSAFSDAEAARWFPAVCELHSSVFGAAPVPPTAEVAQRFAATLHGPRLARRFVTDILRQWHLAELGVDSALVVTELATNAVLHAGSDFTVGLTRRPDALRLIVGDASRTPPVPRRSGPSAPGGRGLHIVASLARAWAHQLVDGGKLVWADLSRTSAELGGGQIA